MQSLSHSEGSVAVSNGYYGLYMGKPRHTFPNSDMVGRCLSRLGTEGGVQTDLSPLPLRLPRCLDPPPHTRGKPLWGAWELVCVATSWLGVLFPTPGLVSQWQGLLNPSRFSVPLPASPSLCHGPVHTLGYGVTAGSSPSQTSSFSHL